MLKGLPDFQRPMHGDGFEIFYPFEAGAAHTIVTTKLKIAARSDNRPDFSLEFVRGENPQLPPAPYGVLDFRVQPDVPIAKALTQLREQHAQALMTDVNFVSGSLAMWVVGNDAQPFEEELLLAPAALKWNGLSVARLIIKLSHDAANVIKRALADELLTLNACALVEVEGVAPRLPAHVRFNPARLLAEIIALGNAVDNDKHHVARDEILKFFRRDLSKLPLEITSVGTGNLDANDFAETLTDKISTRYAAAVLSPVKAAAKSYLELPSVEAINSGSVEWDLSQPAKVSRPFMLALHPLEAAREIVRRENLDAIVRETIVPQITTGMFPITVSANLVANRIGVNALGVTLHAPPRPPQRLQAMTKTVELNPPQDFERAVLRFAATEKPVFECSTFVVLEDALGTQLEGEPKIYNSEIIELDVEDFPLKFVSIAASKALLEIAETRGVCRRAREGATIEQPFELTLDAPSIALAVPRDATNGQLEFEFRSLSNARTLNLEAQPLQDTFLDLHTFPGYGSHTVKIQCDVRDESSRAYEFAPENTTDDAAQIAVLNFTRSRPAREWTYFAASPFESGYRFRAHRNANEPIISWSEIRSPFETLVIESDVSVGRGR